jgi:hypothetical protein
MGRNDEPSGSVAALPEVLSGALQGHRTADTGNRAVSMRKFTTVLAWRLAWKPRVAMWLGRLVLRLWPSFWRV